MCEDCTKDVIFQFADRDEAAAERQAEGGKYKWK